MRVWFFDRWARCLALAAFGCLFMAGAWAHKASDAYLVLRQEGDLVAVRWDVALRDVESVVPLDANDDGQITWGEVLARQASIEGHLLARLSLQGRGADKACVLSPARQARPMLEKRVDGTYYVLRLSGPCPSAAGQYALTYRFMQKIDPTHRGLLKLQGRDDQVVSLVPDGAPVWVSVSPAKVASWRDGWVRASYTPDLAVAPDPATEPKPVAKPVDTEAAHSAWALLRDGIHHILIGTDHVLFLICLLLPAVLTQARTPVDTLAQAVKPVLMTVTMFTLAHSITLALAALQWVSLSPRLIEPAIALTIVLAAIDNLRPIFAGRRHAFTFLFGLVHGFGFAGVLSELSLPTAGFIQALLAFNLGVEVGQLIVVVPALTLLMLIRRWPIYPRRLMPAGSVLAIVVALGWLVERVFDWGFMPI